MPKVDRHRQNLGYMLGLGIGLACIFILVLPRQEKLHMKGPMNIGHTALTCQSCHKPATGTARQQIQANVKYLLGLRGTPVNFRYQKVTNSICLACHQRPNDRHPVFRFFEPRFAEARKKIQPQFCITCHREHSGRRVTISQTTFCLYCHKETKVKNDPISTSHEKLILSENWESCLRCHDFHGNHVMETKIVLEEAPMSEQIRRYFEGSFSPYSSLKYFKARQEISND